MFKVGDTDVGVLHRWSVTRRRNISYCTVISVLSISGFALDVKKLKWYEQFDAGRCYCDVVAQKYVGRGRGTQTPLAAQIRQQRNFQQRPHFLWHFVCESLVGHQRIAQSVNSPIFLWSRIQLFFRHCI